MARARPQLGAVAARPTARDDADARPSDRRAAGAAEPWRGAVSPRPENHRARRIRRRSARATHLRPLDVAGDPDQHHNSRGPRPDRAAPDGARDRSRRGRGRARGGGRRTARGAGRRGVQRGRPSARGDRRRSAAQQDVDDRRRRVVHGRPARLAADRRARQLGLRRSGRGVLQQPLEDRLARRARRAHCGARRSERSGRGGDGGPRSIARGCERRRRPDRHRRAGRRHAAEAGRHGCDCGQDRR